MYFFNNTILFYFCQNINRQKNYFSNENILKHTYQLIVLNNFYSIYILEIAFIVCM